MGKLVCSSFLEGKAWYFLLWDCLPGSYTSRVATSCRGSHPFREEVSDKRRGMPPKAKGKEAEEKIVSLSKETEETKAQLIRSRDAVKMYQNENITLNEEVTYLVKNELAIEERTKVQQKTLLTKLAQAKTASGKTLSGSTSIATLNVGGGTSVTHFAKVSVARACVCLCFGVFIALCRFSSSCPIDPGQLVF